MIKASRDKIEDLFRACSQSNLDLTLAEQARV